MKTFGRGHDFVLTQAQARGLASDELEDYKKRLTNFQLKNLMNHRLNKTETDEFKYINSLNDFEDKKGKMFNKLKYEYRQADPSFITKENRLRLRLKKGEKRIKLNKLNFQKDVITTDIKEIKQEIENKKEAMLNINGIININTGEQMTKKEIREEIKELKEELKDKKEELVEVKQEIKEYKETPKESPEQIIIDNWTDPHLGYLLEQNDPSTASSIEDVISDKTKKGGYVIDQGLLAFTRKYNNKLLDKYSGDEFMEGINNIASHYGVDRYKINYGDPLNFIINSNYMNKKNKLKLLEASSEKFKPNSFQSVLNSKTGKKLIERND